MFSFTFLNSGILFLTSAIIIPVLIYLFAKKKPRKIIFSSIKFIKLSQKQQRKKINLKNILLLIIRMLIILFTVLAISRPSIRSPYLTKGTSHPKTAVAIIIDNSYSMDYLLDTRTQLEKAKDTALKINDILTENDITLIQTMDSNWNDLHGNLRYGKIPVELIRGVDITAVVTPLQEILESTEAKLKDSHLPNREIYVLTDLQDQHLSKNTQIPVYLISPETGDEQSSNLSCQNARIVNEIVGARNQRSIQFDIVNHSEFEHTDVILDLYLNGYKTAEKVTDLNPLQRKSESFRVDLEEAGWLTGYVDVKNERLAYDNRNYFTYYFNPQPSVAVITDLADLPLSLATILEIYAGNELSVDLLREDDINLEQLLNYDNILIYRKRELSGRLSFLIDKLIQNDKGILFITDPDLSQKWRGKLAELFPVTFQEFKSDTDDIVTTFINPYHFITELISDKRSLEFGQIWSAKASTDVLIQAEEYPLVIEKEKQILWLFDVADLRNPFLIDSVFPVFTYNCLQFMVASDIMGSSSLAGDRFRVSSNEIILPSGDMILWNQERYITNETGIYYFDQRPVAVNLDYAESSMVKMDPEDNKNVTILRDGSLWF